MPTVLEQTCVATRQELDIAAEWDALADIRARQIASGADVSYRHILVPTVAELLSRCDTTNVVDVGCGTGFLTEKIARQAAHVTGIDLSARSIALAQADCPTLANLQFVHGSVEGFAGRTPAGAYSLAVANMMLMTAPSLEAVLSAIARLVAPKGRLIFTITHPCFWPRYWAYADAEWFDYCRETIIRAPFRITFDTAGELWSTHIHRPIQQYVQSFRRAGFLIELLLEPMPGPKVADLYPEPWEFPRFLAGLCLRDSAS